MLVRESIRRNFKEGGRPQKWPLSKRAEEQRGQTLIDTKVLMNSITSDATENEAVVGTNVEYAAVHNFGAKKGSFGTVTATIRAHLRKGVQVREHTRKMNLPWGDIPAREFMLVQDEDWADIREVVGNYLTQGATR